MSLEGLREAILAEARQQADKLTSEAENQVSSEEQRILQRAKEIEEAIIREGESEGTQRAQQLHQQTELAGRAHVLQAKEVEIEKTKQVVLDQIYEQEPAPLIAALLKLVPDEGGTITAGEKHAAEVKKQASKLNVAATTIPNEGGFVFEGKYTELNVTVSHLVDRIFKKHRAEIASVLFS